ncbi:FixH family protein [Paracrocinitomix mangrovi]|uniref:FixH family protein n=1 Tax=Paracrocinitomix mangrovi TaxID=2862509 RepID=UPI001C8D5DAA|nr:FixH family protein [Paracrocinitomix mangrovi]UKN01487.1 FixH family protein [Paracrocinitomix mangrovi]
MNWGKGITIGIAAFMLFILSFVYRATQYEAELVTDNYYEEEVNIDKDKVSRKNYKELNENVNIIQKEEGVCFHFPENVQNSEGTIEFYRADGKIFDRTFSIEADNNGDQCLPYEEFVKGRYDVSVRWNDKQKDYLFEDDIQF